MAKICLRQAHKNDAADLAILDDIAGHGISSWFWRKAKRDGEGDNALEIGRERFRDETSVFGWKNATVAHEEEDILGSVTSYVMEALGSSEQQFKRDASTFVPIFELFDEVVGDWFIDSLAVYREARGRGVGSMLVDDSLEKAKSSGADRASLVVEDSNHAARQIYETRGFVRRSSRPFIEYDGPSETKEWLLLTVEL